MYTTGTEEMGDNEVWRDDRMVDIRWRLGDYKSFKFKECIFSVLPRSLSVHRFLASRLT